MKPPLIRDWTCTACGRSGTVVIAPRDSTATARERLLISHTAQNPRRSPRYCRAPHFTTADRPPRTGSEDQP
jgi:hypothetical protein